MLLHYLKIAVLNLLKYKTQSVISILGLAIGLACFALATLWVKYEQSYDAFHEDAERLYYVKADSSSIASNREFVLPYPLGKRLKDNHPEIEDYAVFNRVPNRLYTGNVRKEVNFISADSSFMNFMHIKIVAGNTHFMMKGSKEVAITEQMAVDEDGKMLKDVQTYYQLAQKRIEKIKAEDFFRNGKKENPADGLPVRAVRIE